MLRKNSKILSFIVTAIMFASVLSGCNKEKLKPTDVKEEEPITLDWLAYQTQVQPDSDSDVVKMIEKKFNVKLNYWFVDDQKWDDVLNVRLAAGEMPDVMRVKDINNIEKYIKMGVASELPVETIKKYAPNYFKNMDKYDSQKLMWNVMKYSGKNYGFAMINLDGTYPGAIEWRTDWLNNVGITKIPETLQEWETAMYKFRNDDPDKNGKKDTYGMSVKAMEAIYGAYGINNAWGLNTMMVDGQIKYTAIRSEAKEALTLLQKWYKDGIIDPEFVTGENKGGYWALSHSFMNGRIGVTGGISFYHYSPPNTAEGSNGGPCYAEMAKVNPQAAQAVQPGKPPVGPTGKSGVGQGGYVAEKFLLTTKCMKEEKKTKKILEMLDALFIDEDYAVTTMWGYKDVNWKIDTASNSLVTIPLPDNSPVQKKGIMTVSFLQGNQDITKKYKPSRYDYADKYFKYNGYISPMIPVTEEASKNGGTLKKLVDEAYIKIITGEKPISYFDDFVNQFKSSGGDATEKAMTDAYKKAYN